MSDITPADALRELGDDQAEYAAAAAKRDGDPTWSGLFGAGGPDFDPDPDDTEGRKKIAELEAEVERLRTWIRKGPELRRTWAAEERAEKAFLRVGEMHAEVARRDEVLDEVRSAFRACFTPDVGGWDWRDDDAVQTLARSLSRALSSLNTSSTQESP